MTLAHPQLTFSGNGLAGDLLDPANWVGGVAPTVNNDALFTTGVGAPVEGVFSINSIMLLGHFQMEFAGTLDIAAVEGGCSGLMVCAGAEAVFAPGAVLNDGQALIAGAGAVGTVVAEGSGSDHSVLNTVDAFMGQNAAGVGTITIDDAIWNNSGRAAVGNFGEGTLNIVDNGVMNEAGDIDIGIQVGSSGTMTVASGGSVDVAGNFSVGNWTAGSTATATVDAGSGITVDGTMLVGDGGTLDLAGGTVSAGTGTNSILVWTGGEISGYGTLAAPNGVAIWDKGIILATGGTLDVAGSVAGPGAIEIAANSAAVITGDSVKVPTIAFIGSDATLSLASGAGIGAEISGFGLGDLINVANINAASFQASTGYLTMKENNVTVGEIFDLSGSFTGDTFSVHTTVAGATISLQHS